MIQPNFATLLCFVQTDALVEDPGAALRPAVDCLLQPDHRRRPDEHQRHRLAAGERRVRQAAPEGLLDAVLLQLAIEIVRRRRGRRRGSGRTGSGRRRPGRGRAGRAGDRQLAPGQDRAVRSRPQRWGRIAQAAGMALAGEEHPRDRRRPIDVAELGEDTREAEIALRLESRRAQRPRLLLRPRL